MMPLDYMLSVLRNPSMPHRDRMGCAIAAAPYCHPKLTQVDVRAYAQLNAQHGNATLDPAFMTYEQREMLRHAMTMTATLALAGDLIEGERVDDAA